MASSVIEKEGKLKKLVNEVEHITFSGRVPSRRGRTSPMSPSAA
jgi:acyl CoA:acetate/3-ketoacid CoA transferase